MKFDALSASQQKEVHELLERFGLGPKDRLTYVTLLELGKTTVTPLAAAMRVPTTTAQSAVERLVRAGLVGITSNKTRRSFEAYDPIVLKKILERNLQEIGETLPLLRELRAETAGPAKVRVYMRERVADIFHLALQARSKRVYEIVAASDIQDVLGEKFHFSRRRMAAGIFLKSLRVEAHEIKRYSEATHKRELREARFLPRELTFRSTVMFWDDVVAIFTTKSEGIAIVIHSPTLREMFTQLFDLLWSVSRHMATKGDESL